jgi:glycerol-3-phosphate dehydrogenase
LQTGLVVYDLMAGQRSHFYADLATTQHPGTGLAPPGLRGALVFGTPRPTTPGWCCVCC